MMKESFLQYSMSVICSRALPDVRDGLKPVHRRILYTMYENGLYPDKPYRKCADTVGSVLGKYHPHGDASVYDALVRMAQPFSLRYPMVDGQGNFGTVDGDPAAAYRYTEAKMAKMSLHMLSDINKDTVDFQPNYDDRLQEPVVLPSRFPHLLVNGSNGIAVGMATNIPPHNLGEVIDAMKLIVENPDCTLDELMQCIKGPDFPTGGIIMGRSGIRAAYGTGRGKLTLRGDAEITEIKGRQCIIIHEIPYMVNKRKLIESIAQLHKDKRIEGIHDLRDESNLKEGIRVVIELKKDAIPQVILNKLYNYTQLQDTVGVIMLALVDGVPKTLTLKQMLEHYIDFQAEVITRRTKFDLKKAKEREHILEGLKIALDNIDEVIDIMKTSKNVPEAKERLCTRFSLSDIQADHIANMTLARLTGLEQQKIFDELNELRIKIADLEDILANHDRILHIMIEEVEAIQEKFGDKRRTRIENVSGEVDVEDLIPVEENVVTYTNGGYIKRMPVSAYKAQNRGGRGITAMKQREDDFVEEMYICSSHDNLLFISNMGVMYKLKCYELPEGSKASKGTHIVNVLQLREGEKIAAMIKTADFDPDHNIVICTKNGKIKRTSLAQYQNVRKKGIIAIGLDENDEIAAVRMTSGESQLIIATKNGNAIRIKETDIRLMSRSAHGVKAIKLRGEDSVVSMARVREGASVLTVTDGGLGRKCSLEDYRVQRRGGYGLKNYRIKDDVVCGIKVIDEDNDIIMISSDGVIIRLRAADIRLMGRYARGVRLMKLNGDNKVVAFTRAEHDDSAEIEKVDDSTAEDISEEEAKKLAEEEAKAEAEAAAEPDDDNGEE
ncbi:MAG: DNA gyrase subunit A [Ruminococcus sp.]|nr:DNA gyrase subunit A [Ruminococcus sp.]